MDFEELGEDVKKEIAPYLVSAYVYSLLEEGRYRDALYVVVNAVDKGYGNEYLRSLWKYVSSLYSLDKFLSLTDVVFKYIDRITPSYISYLIEKIEHHYDRLKDVLPEETKSRIEKILSLLRDAYEVSMFYEDAVDTISRAYNTIKKFMDMVESGRNNLDMLANAFGYGKTELPGILNSIKSLVDRAVDVENNEMTALVNRLKQALKNVEWAVKGFHKLSVHGLPIIGSLQALLYDLKNYGGSNVLANPYYRNALREKIKTVLVNAKALKGLSSFLEYPEEARDIMRGLAESSIEILNNIKKELGQGDGRFVDLFEEAESIAGVNLVDVEKPSSVIPGLDEFVREVAERNALAFRSDPIWLKILGAVGIIGSGALDNLTILLRPVAFWEQLEAIKTMLSNTAENVREKGVVGLGESAKALFLDMFGTPERALYTIGGILSAIAISKAVEKLPLPTKWKAVLTDVLQGDPVGLVISGSATLGLTKILRYSIAKPGAGKIVVDTLPEGFDAVIRKALKESVETAMAKHVVEVSDVLARKIARMIRRGTDLTEIKNAVKEVVEKYGLENLVKDYNKYVDMRLRIQDALRKYIATEANMDSIARKIKASELRKLLPEVPSIKILLSLDDIRRNVLPGLKELVEKYRNLLDENDYRILAKRISELEDALRKGDLGETATLLQRINSYILGEISLDTLKTEMVTTFERLGLVDLMKKVERIANVSDLVKLLKDIDKALLKKLDPSIMRALDTVSDVFRKLERTRLGRLFNSLRNKLMQKIMVRMSEMPDPELSRILGNTLSKIDAEKLPPDLRKIVNSLREKVREGSITLKDIEAFTEKLAETDAVRAGLIDLAVVNELINNALRHLDELVEKAPLEIRSIITAVRDKIAELSMHRILGGEGEVFYGRVLALNPVQLNLKYTLDTLVDYVDRLNPAYAGRLKGLVEKFTKELGRGRVSENTLKELFNELRNIRNVKGIKIGLLSRLKNAVKSYVDWIDEKNMYKPEAISSLRRLADIVVNDIESLEKELTRGWGFITYKVGEAEVKLPLKTDIDTVRRFRELMDNPIVEKHLRIGDIDIVGRRRAVLEPDGTFKIEYELIFPENRVLRIMQVTRPVKTLATKLKSLKALAGKPLEAKVDVYYRIYFDPALRELFTRNPMLYREIVTGSILSKIDPLFPSLDNIIVYRVDLPLSVSIAEALKALPYLLLIPTAVKPELVRSLIGEKEDFLKILTEKFIEEPEKPTISGIDVLKLVRIPPDKEVVIGIPYTSDFLDMITGWTLLRHRDKTLLTPKIKIGSKQYYLLIPIDLQLEKPLIKQALKKKTVTIPKPETKTATVPSPPEPIPTAVVPTPFTGTLPPYIGIYAKGVGAVGKTQYEEIRL